MADDKNAREDQARAVDRRQRERDIAAELERGDEPEPPVDPAVLDDVEAALDGVDFPATGATVVATAGSYAVPADGRTYEVADLVADAATERFETPRGVRRRVARPTVARAMKRVAAASAEHGGERLESSQRTAYEKTFRALDAVEIGDDAVDAVADWAVERLRERGALPGSRVLRKQAASVCRERGIEVRDDDWLGA